MAVLALVLAAVVQAPAPAPATTTPAAPVPSMPAVIRVGMETRQPPWSFIPGDDLSGEDFRKDPEPLTPAQAKTLTGIDVDIVAALGKRLGVTLKLVPSSWFLLESNLLAKKFDLILSSWTPNPRTPPGITASAPYLEWGLLVAVRAEDTKIQSYASLDGHRVGHYRDPAVERSLQAMGHGTFVSGDDPEVLFADLKAKKLDAVIFDSPYVRWKVAGDKTLRMVGEPLNKLGYHVGVRTEDAALLAKVQAALQAMAAAGEIDAIRKKWESPSAPR